MTERETIHAEIQQFGYTEYGSTWMGSHWFVYASRQSGADHKAAFDQTEIIAWRDILKQVRET